MTDNKIKRILFCAIFLVLVFLGYFLGLNSTVFSDYSDLEIVVNDEKQIFRDSNGKIINPIRNKNTIYLPVNGLGSYLDYMTINDEKGLSFYKVENKFQGSVQSQRIFEGLDTKTIYGEQVTDDIFADSNYTVVMFWASWCKYCKAEIESFVALNNYLDENNIQFVFVITDLPSIEDNNIIQENIDTVESIQGNFDVDYILLRNSFIDENFLNGSYSLPKLYIIDNQGSLVKIINDRITSEQFVEIFDAILR